MYKVGTRQRKSEEEKQLVQERRKRGGYLYQTSRIQSYREDTRKKYSDKVSKSKW